MELDSEILVAQVVHNDTREHVYRTTWKNKEIKKENKFSHLYFAEHRHTIETDYKLCSLNYTKNLKTLNQK